MMRGIGRAIRKPASESFLFKTPMDTSCDLLNISECAYRVRKSGGTTKEAIPVICASETCKVCEAPARIVWPPSAAQPKLEVLLREGWLRLLRCYGCRSIWNAVPHEPYASFVYLSLWPCSVDEWLSVATFDEGLTLCRWGDARVKAAWPSMNETDRVAIEAHRKRSLGRNPIDDIPDQSPPDIDRLLNGTGS